MVPLRMVLPDILVRLGRMNGRENDLSDTSINLAALGQKITSLDKPGLILLAARPGMGKTALALNMALSIAKSEKKTIVFFSLDMSREQLAARLLSFAASSENSRPHTGIRRGPDREKILKAASTLSQLDILIDDNPMLTAADMTARCCRLDGPGLAVIDYFQLLTFAGSQGQCGENRRQAVSDTSRMLKSMAEELNVPVLCLSQLSRAVETRNDKRPVLSDLRESGALVREADLVLFLYRDGYYDENSEKSSIAECIIAKNCCGETGTVELRWLSPSF